MRIPLSAPDITEVEIAAVQEVLRSGRLSLGPKLEEFEARMKERIGVPHAVALSSGTAGLHLTLTALDLHSDEEVITSPFSFIASANAILYAGAKPVFVDIDPYTYNLDPAAVERAITPQTRAILVVHVFGRPAPMGPIREIARRRNLRVIEDACEALGARSEGRAVGNLGDAGIFGFYPNKQITTGEGGIITTTSLPIAEHARCGRNQGRSRERATDPWYDHVDLGYNYRLAEIPCALGIAQLSRLDDILLRRRRVAEMYDARLGSLDALYCPPLKAPGGDIISWFVYVVRLSERYERRHRDWIHRELEARGIGAGRYFAPIHLQPLYRDRFQLRPGQFPHAEHVADRALALPFSSILSEASVEEVCRELRVLLTQSRAL